MKNILFETSILVKALLWLRPDILKKTFAVLVTVLLISTGSFLFVPNPEMNPIADGKAASQNTYRTTTPKKITEGSKPIVLGKVVSNETANVYSRREGLVEDIFFDIGDRIEKGQVLATLLPPGVEGENTASIEEKQSLVNRASSNLAEARRVARSSVEQAKIKLREKELALQKSIATREAQVNKAQTVAGTTWLEEQSKVETTEQETKLIEANLNLLKEQLQTSEKMEDAELEKRRANILQFKEQLQIAFRDVEQVAKDVLLGGNTQRDYRYVSTEDLDESIKSLRSGTSFDLVELVNDLSGGHGSLNDFSALSSRMEILYLIEKANQAALKTQEILNNLTPGPYQTAGDMSNMIANVNRSHMKLLEAKQDYEDALNNYELSMRSQSEKITLLRNQIAEKEESLDLAKKKHKLSKRQKNKSIQTAQRELERTQAIEKSDVELMRAQVDLAREDVELTRARQNKMVAVEASNLGVASAQLKKETAKSAHTEIKSPFSGVISKRSITVGEMVSMNMPAFELIDVKTSLSEKAKREIQFLLPEELDSEITIGETVDFYLLENDFEVYQAVVTRKSPQVDGESHTITVQAKLDDSIQLAHNLSIRVRLSESDQDIYRVPSAALKRDQDGNYLWVLSDDDAPLRLLVNVLADDGEFAEITGEIDQSTEVILDPPDLLPEQVTDEKGEDNDSLSTTYDQ